MKDLKKIKTEIKEELKKYGYTDFEFLDDIVAVARPGVVLIKESIMEKYTGRLSEMYL